MRKIQIFRWNDAKKVEDEVNEFIKDKNVISIQHQMCPIYDKFTGSGIPTSLTVYYSVMVEYEESGGTFGVTERNLILEDKEENK